MIRKGMALLAWLLAGHALLGGLFWGLVNTPDSNTLMLAASALLILVLIATAAIVEGTAAAWLLPGRSFRQAMVDAMRAVPAFVIALLVAAACWWVAGQLDAWHVERRGEIDAWMIAKFNAPDATFPHRALDVVAFVLRAIIGVSLAIAALFARLEGGFGRLARLTWVRTAFSRDQLMLVAIGMTLFVALPWHFAYWRPATMPVSWVQPAFASAKLGLIYVAANVGWLICLLGGSRNASPRP